MQALEFGNVVDGCKKVEFQIGNGQTDADIRTCRAASSQLKTHPQICSTYCVTYLFALAPCVHSVNKIYTKCILKLMVLLYLEIENFTVN